MVPKMKKFPNKKIATAYESARGKVFTKNSSDLTYKDQTGSTDYDHIALNWLEDNGVLDSKLHHSKWVFEYRLVK